MTFAQIIQLYAPFAGLMALAFWMGVLSQRVRQLEKSSEGQGSVKDTVIELKTKMEIMMDTLKALDRNMQNTNRQLANIATKRHGAAVYEMDGDEP